MAAAGWTGSGTEALILFGIMALSLLLRLAFLHEPFERDEGHYAVIAQVILDGGLPYRDAIEIKPPGVFYLYALGIWLFGASVEAIRIFSALYALMTLGAVYAVARLMDGVRSARAAALLFGIFSTAPLLTGSSANSEVFLLLPLTAAVGLLIQGWRTALRGFYFASGLCAALAMLIKPVALPVVALLFLLLFVRRSDTKGLAARLLDMAWFCLPMLLSVLVMFGYFYLNGALNDLLYWTVEFPQHYARVQGLGGPSLRNVLQFLASSLLVPVMLAIPSAIWLAVTRRDKESLLILLLIPAAMIAVCLPGKNFPHYFIVLLPFLSLPGGIGLMRLWRNPSITARAALVLIGAACAYSVFDNYRYYLVYTPEAVSQTKYGPTFVESVAIAHYLKERTRSGEYIFQWGFEPELYFLADRRPPSRYVVSILPEWSKDPQRSVNEMVWDILKKKPVYIVFQPEWADFAGSDKVRTIMSSLYHFEKQIHYAYLFRRNEGQ